MFIILMHASSMWCITCGNRGVFAGFCWWILSYCSFEVYSHRVSLAPELFGFLHIRLVQRLTVTIAKSAFIYQD